MQRQPSFKPNEEIMKKNKMYWLNYKISPKSDNFCSLSAPEPTTSPLLLKSLRAFGMMGLLDAPSTKENVLDSLHQFSIHLQRIVPGTFPITRYSIYSTSKCTCHPIKVGLQGTSRIRASAELAVVRLLEIEFIWDENTWEIKFCTGERNSLSQLYTKSCINLYKNLHKVWGKEDRFLYVT